MPVPWPGGKSVAVSRSIPPLFTWLARAAWLLVAVLGGAAIGNALASHSRPVQVVGTTGAWVGWSTGAVGLALAGVTTLTLVRAIVPGSLVVSVAALVDGVDARAAAGLLVPSIVAAVLVCGAEFGRVYLQASAYGDERRFGLRPPYGYLLACVVSWLVAVSAAVTAALSWASRAWVLAVVATVVAGVGAWLLPRRWHQLSRRWFVLVPAGAVIHDPVVLADTLMMPRASIASIALDLDGVARRRAADLSGPTPGLGVEIRLTDTATAVFAATPRDRSGRAIHLVALVIVPSRPGSVVTAARERALPT